jgi:hypothetical protein
VPSTFCMMSRVLRLGILAPVGLTDHRLQRASWNCADCCLLDWDGTARLLGLRVDLAHRLLDDAARGGRLRLYLRGNRPFHSADDRWTAVRCRLDGARLHGLRRCRPDAHDGGRALTQVSDTSAWHLGLPIMENRMLRQKLRVGQFRLTQSRARVHNL